MYRISETKGMFEMADTKAFDSAVEILSEDIRAVLKNIPDSKKNSVQEIRIRSNKPLALSDGASTVFTDVDGKIMYTMSEKVFQVSQRSVYDTFRRLCDYSVYSRQDEIKNGYITVKGGHRVGLCGTAVLTDGKISALNDISSMNIRIARQVFGASEEIINHLYPFESGILIAGVPSSGKTTLLRDLARSLSLGIGCHVTRTAVIDERGELSGTYSGQAYNDMGLCDVLNGYPKGDGIIHAIRAMSPQVIICDELGTNEDCRLVSQGFNAGAVVIASIHAGSYEELLRRKQAVELIETGAFGNIVILESANRPCKIAKFINLGE